MNDFSLQAFGLGNHAIAGLLQGFVKALQLAVQVLLVAFVVCQHELLVAVLSDLCTQGLNLLFKGLFVLL